MTAANRNAAPRLMPPEPAFSFGSLMRLVTTPPEAVLTPADRDLLASHRALCTPEFVAFMERR